MPKPLRVSPPRLAVIVGVLLSLSIAGTTGFWQHTTNSRNYDERFAALTDEFAGLVSQRFHLYQYGLRGARGAIVAGGGVDTTRETFANYFSTRDQFREFPGARGIGFIERVPNSETDRFITLARIDGFPEFSVRELSPNSGERFIIKFIYPLEGNEGATGLDIASETNRQNAAQEAALTGAVRLTAPITLVQASGQTNHGFLILMPIYEIGANLDSPENRLAANYGWSYSPLVVSEVLSNLGPRRDEIAFSITDTGDGTEFFKSEGFDGDKAATRRDLAVLGRTWRLTFHALPAFYDHNPSVTPLLLSSSVAASGLILTLVVFIWLRNREQSWQKRREGEEFAYKIIEAAPQAVLVVDADGTILRANSYCKEIFGHGPEELSGRSIDSLVPGKFRAGHSLLREDYDFRSRDMADRRDLEALRADGKTIPVVVRLSPLEIGDRKLVVVGVTDVSLEQDAIKVLTASQERWQEMANSLPQLVWTCNSAGACDFLSEQWVNFTGIPAEEQVGMGWLEQVHPDDRRRLGAAWSTAVAETTSFAIEFRIRRKDGVYRWFYTRAEPVQDENGTVHRWIGSNTDIEDRYVAEQQVRVLLDDLEQRVAQRTDELNTALKDLQNVLDAVPSMIGYWDRDLRNRFANNAYLQWYGRSPEWLKDRHMSELVGDDGFKQVLPYAQGALDGELQRFERNIVDREGNRRTIQVHYLPDMVDGEVLGFYLLAFDVSAIKESEIAQKEAREAAENATRAKSAFLTSMSHELRTPMNSILGFADLLIGQHFGPLNQKQMEHADRIRQSGEHLLNLMDGVLELSKIEAGRIGVSIEPINAVAAIKSVAANLEILAENYGVELKTDKLNDAQDYVKADATRLTQILINLGSNAIKYNRPGGWVDFRLKKNTDGTTRIIVSDNGQGIPLDRQADAFQPFNRLGAEKGKIEGSGIGLALVRNYVELMGGAIGFSSEEGKGSEFWINLQSVDDQIADQPGDGTRKQKKSRPNGERNLRVLYVEDNEVNRSLFKYYMEALEGIDMLEAEDGPSGLMLAKTGRPDLIFLDVNLPGMDGYEVLQNIRSDSSISEITVVALTANAMSGDEQTGLMAGFNEYLTKPVRIEQLRAIVDRFRKKLTTGQ